MSHTPGPWKAVDAGKHWNNPTLTNIEIHYSEDGECIADTVYEMDDALLIAAAPDLLAALKALLAHPLLEFLEDPEGDAAHVAIAKAEGRTA